VSAEDKHSVWALSGSVSDIWLADKFKLDSPRHTNNNENNNLRGFGKQITINV
jgi:hypothetical protein